MLWSCTFHACSLYRYTTSVLHVFASTCNFYKYATCLCLNSAMKFYFRMELFSSPHILWWVESRYFLNYILCSILIINESFSVSPCAVSPTYLISGFDKNGLCPGISHFLHHRWTRWSKKYPNLPTS